MAAAVMIAFTLICQAFAAPMVAFFSGDPQVVAVGNEYLSIVSWTFAASGIIYVGSSMFQALGHTLPALLASFSRIVLVTVPAFILSRTPGFQLNWIWYLSVGALIVQLAVNLLLLRREMRRRLAFPPAVAPMGAVERFDEVR
jgi:Na+-driven multidrug efflux pump